jgi:hypothetical protein
MPETLIGAIVPCAEQTSIREREKKMEPILISDDELVEESIDEELLIRDWRVEQLQRLGLPRTLAETFAGLVDWHEIAALVGRGCPPELALEIAR